MQVPAASVADCSGLFDSAHYSKTAMSSQMAPQGPQVSGG